MNSNKGTIKIGVLGGIGPEATSEFYLNLIIKLQKSGLIKHNEDFPQIIINSIPAPELVFDSVAAENLVPYSEGLKQLDGFGVDFIVMVCNTVHIFYDKLQGQISTPILDLRKEVHKAMESRKVESFLIIGTPATIEQNLYSFNGIKCVKPNHEEVKMLSDAIFNFNKGMKKDAQKKTVEDIAKKYLQNKEANTILIGCTELGVMLSHDDFHKIDTMDVLADATVRRFAELKKQRSGV